MKSTTKSNRFMGNVVGQKIKENTEPIEVQFGVMTVKQKTLYGNKNFNSRKKI